MSARDCHVRPSITEQHLFCKHVCCSSIRNQFTYIALWIGLLYRPKGYKKIIFTFDKCLRNNPKQSFYQSKLYITLLIAYTGPAVYSPIRPVRRIFPLINVSTTFPASKRIISACTRRSPIACRPN